MLADLERQQLIWTIRDNLENQRSSTSTIEVELVQLHTDAISTSAAYETDKQRQEMQAQAISALAHVSLLLSFSLVKMMTEPFPHYSGSPRTLISVIHSTKISQKLSKASFST